MVRKNNSEGNKQDRKISEEESTNRLIIFFTENKYGKIMWRSTKTILPFIIIAIIYEVLAVILNASVSSLNSNILPPTHKIISFAFDSLIPGPDSSSKSVMIDILWSLLRVLIGFLSGVLSGILVGIIMGFSQILYRLFNPLFSLMISIPTLAWVPILIILVGLNIRTIIITIALSCFFPIVYSTTSGIRSIDKKLIWAARMMGANNIEIFFDVLLRGSLVSIISGLRLAIGYSWRAVVGAEILVTLTEGTGIGFYIMGGRSANMPVQIIVGVLLIAIMGLLLELLFMTPLETLTLKRWGMVEKSKG